MLLIPACLYSVDVGEVAVIRNMGGSLAGHSEDAGFHLKTPWQSIVKYDTRNNLINFYKDTDYKYDGGSAVGKQVTVNDRSGASADIDIQVNYSLDPSAAEYLYSSTASSRRSRRTTSATIFAAWLVNSPAGSTL